MIGEGKIPLKRDAHSDEDEYGVHGWDILLADMEIIEAARARMAKDSD